MRRVVTIAALAVAIAAAVFWLRGRGASAKKAPAKPTLNLPAATGTATETGTEVETEAEAVAVAAAAPVAAPAPVVAARLDPLSDAFRDRLEVILPSSFQAAAARCWRADLPRDQKLKLEYRLHVADGEVFADRVRVASSTIDDRNFERCAIDAVSSTRFTDTKMPDWESTEELLLRVRALKQFVDDSDE